MPSPASNLETTLRWLAAGTLLLTAFVLTTIGFQADGSAADTVTVTTIGGFAFIGLFLASTLVAGKSAPPATPSGNSLTFEQTLVGTAVLNRHGVVVAVNPAMCAQTGLSRDELVGRHLALASHVSDKDRHTSEINDLLQGHKAQTQFEHRYHHPDGTDIWVSEHLIREGDDESARILVQCLDITHRRQATWELARHVLHDELTGLPNRAMLLYRLRAALRSVSDTTTVGVMFIDVDRFKVVNDSLGHDVGDQLIKFVGNHIATAIRHGDTVARFGGDEFVVLCPGLVDEDEVLAVAERVHGAIDIPFRHTHGQIDPTLSIGIATCAPGALTADELLRDADAAMYRAKARGRNRYEVFDEGMRGEVVEKLELENDLRIALREENLIVHYQPIVELASGRTVGFESLVRWPHPTRGLLTPGQFLSIAEDAGLQADLDGLALRQAATQLAEWDASFPAAHELYMSSNVVPKDFAIFVQRIEQTLQDSGLEAGRLMVEVVEGALLSDADGSMAAIERLREINVAVAIDDFGTGYSSLSYLTRFRPAKLKIDRSFVSRLPDDAATVAVVQAIASMAKALDITVIAEGVETSEQAHALRSYGVQLGQGFLFAKPRPAAEITEWFERSESRDVQYLPSGFFLESAAGSV